MITFPASPILGQPTRRVDGPLKVTGAAKYAAEYNVADLLHGQLVSSSIAKGRILRFETEKAMKIPGVVTIFTHENRPKLSGAAKDYEDQVAPPGEHFRPLHDDRVRFSEQPIALVVAETFEAARDAAALIGVHYRAEPNETCFEDRLETAYVPPKKRSGITPPPKPRGDFGKAYAASPQRVSAGYSVAFEHHNPMEPYATTCVWNGDGTLTVYDKTQGSQNVQQYLMDIFDLKQDQVQVINSFVGGGFGSGLRPQHQVFFAVMASRALRRSVRVVLTRDQMWGLSYRPLTHQIVQLGATPEGKLNAIRQHAVANTSMYEDHQEVVVNWVGMMYDSPNVELTYELVKLDAATPSDMRAPGAVIGEFASESALDELAVQLGIDPIELRLRNYSEKDENTDKKFTSKALRECFKRGAQEFGWAKRTSAPRSMHEGKELIGWGVASAAWEAQFQKTAARVTMDAHGYLTVASATSDIGTGTYTIMAQTGADAFGLPLACVTAKLGDSGLPKAPVEGGSWGAASTCSAVQAACENLKKDLVAAARKVQSKPLGRAGVHDVYFADGRIVRKDDLSKSVSLAEAVRASGKVELSAEATAAPSLIEKLRYISYTHAAIFCEVRVDEELGNVRVARIVVAVAAGRILNPKTARSQILGGVVMAIGSTLEEESFLDTKLGRFMNHSLAEYHIPVNADVEGIDVIFVHEEDEKASPIGAKGLGEIGIIGTGAAIANAIFHATGRRVYDLPITVEKVLGIG